MGVFSHPWAARPVARVSPTENVTMPDSPSSISFAGFVISLAHTAAVHFGDIEDPASGQKQPVNVEAAQQMIDILALLEEKTRGNLTAEERQLLEQVLYELRMRFVQASQDSPRIIQP
jgi:uncharacterized protein DUF1844